MSADFAVRNSSSMDYFLQMQKQNDEIAFQRAEARHKSLSAEMEASIESQSMFEKLLKDKIVSNTEMIVPEENKKLSFYKTKENENVAGIDWKVNKEGIQKVSDSDINNGELAELYKTEEKNIFLAEIKEQGLEAESASNNGGNLKTEEKKISLVETADQSQEAESVTKNGENLKIGFAGLEKTEKKNIFLGEIADQVNKVEVASNFGSELAEDQGKLFSESVAVLSDKKSDKNKNVADSALEKINSVFGKKEDLSVDFGMPINEKQKAKKQKSKQEIVKVIDLRKNDASNVADALSQQSTDITAEQKPSANENTTNIANKNFQFADGGEGARSFQFNSAGNTSSEATSTRQSSTVFQNMLFDNLKENGNADIVKNAKFVLKDSGAGEIKLILKPESLGYVRIMLTLEDNNIAGKIIVDNKSVKEVFETNMENLIRSFKENGFSEASLNVSVGIGAGNDNKGNDKSNSFGENRNIFAKKEIEKVDSQRIIRYGMEEEMLVDLVI